MPRIGPVTAALNTRTSYRFLPDSVAAARGRWSTRQSNRLRRLHHPFPAILTTNYYRPTNWTMIRYFHRTPLRIRWRMPYMRNR
jgi:hypothetical protein